MKVRGLQASRAAAPAPRSFKNPRRARRWFQEASRGGAGTRVQLPVRARPGGLDGNLNVLGIILVVRVGLSFSRWFPLNNADDSTNDRRNSCYRQHRQPGRDGSDAQEEFEVEDRWEDGREEGEEPGNRERCGDRRKETKDGRRWMTSHVGLQYGDTGAAAPPVGPQGQSAKT